MTSGKEVVEVFKTNVRNRGTARQIINCLSSVIEGARVSFDLEDVDRVLRIAATTEIQASIVVEIVDLFGYEAEVLEDTILEPR